MGNTERVKKNFVEHTYAQVYTGGREDARSRAYPGELARQRTPIGPYDLPIAGQAKARNLTLITNNTGEFSRVCGSRTGRPSDCHQML
jgi:predicted nucleic acid-binding protein